MSSFFDRFLVILCKLTARLPFWVIFGLADIFYVFLFYIIKYRRNVVHENLIRSFPEKSPKEIRTITKKFYHHLSDIGLETIKFYRMTEKEIDDRLKINNLDIYEEYYNQGKSIIVLGMHHNNWEWSGSMQRFIKAQFLVVYNPVRNNKALEKFILDTRERFGAKSIAINHSVRTALSFNQNERPSGLMLAADQTPPANSQFWTTFLNQETAFFAGPMKIAKKTNQPVIMHHTRKVGRGRYEVFHYKLIENPAEVKPEDILLAYVTKLEEIIRAEPEYWLWSHRRWKHQRPANIGMYKR
ncbi:MAG TPA: lysophospholipid acyltransferase family protein [Prolixibacteraceae bacterium]|nr:lysophospholipid acyltransferase family protein [Prolixibacteraceae bacterium]